MESDTKLTFKRKVTKLSEMIECGVFKKDAHLVQKYVSLFNQSKQINAKLDPPEEVVEEK